MGDSRKDSRTRNWTVIIYPESAPENWRDIIDEQHIEWIESPLHDKDVDEGTGRPKKAHYHVLLMFGGVKSYEQVLDFIQPLHCPIPQKCNNAKSMVRYMAHLDHPHKAQYKVSDIVAHGGVDLWDITKPSSAERYTYIKEMMNWCIDNNVVEIEDLVSYAFDERFDDWFPLICDNSMYVLNTFLTSRRNRLPKNLDTDTGEIL